MMKTVKDESAMTEADSELVDAHCEWLKQRFAEKTVIFAGPSWEENEDHFAIVVLEAENKERAKEIMDNDPAVSGKVLSSHVTAFNVFLSREVQIDNV